jgi:5-methylcytosine-specific restriction protein A
MPRKAKQFFAKPQRPAAHKRGYDAHWIRLRTLYIKAHPDCEECLTALGKRVLARVVDHKIPFKGPTDPLRLSWSNLRALCDSCHTTKTNKDRANGLTTLYQSKA